MAIHDTQAALDRLAETIPPPQKPLETKGSLASLTFANGRPVVFPPDYVQLATLYGSGDFRSDEKYGDGFIGDLVYLMNPRAARYSDFLKDESEFVQEFKSSEGDEYVPYDVYPQTPGVLQWGWCQGRKRYFWLTEGKPKDWPVLVMYDLEIWTRFDMPMTVFLQRLFFGELDCGFIGWPGELSRRDPAKITFHPRIPTRSG
jgi:hypothetical protein